MPFRYGPGSGTRYTRDPRSPTVVTSTVFPTSPKSPVNLQGIQVTVSESHPDWRSVNRPPGDLGGDFFTQKKYVVGSESYVHMDTGWRVTGLNFEERFVYDGPIYLNQSTVGGGTAFPSFTNSTNSGLDAYGATAIARCQPAEPTVNLAAALLEAYHDGLPKLIGRSAWEERVRLAQTFRRKPRADVIKRTARRETRKSADEFLNYQFGWLPIVSDVRDFVSTFYHMHKLLQQYVRDNGNVVRRRYSFPPEQSYVDTTLTTSPAVSGPDGYGGYFNSTVPGCSVVRSRQTTVNRWFSGAFVYHLPQTFFARMYAPFAADFQSKSHLFGLELTPDVLWELTPWSWAVDWFSNVGDVIHNANAWANNGLVMKYGYIMEHSIVRDTYTWSGPSRVYGGQNLIPPPYTMVTETKVRRKANPFGFGLTMGNLSFLQKSILAAVGLTHLL
jgi:hypothetical protein